MYRDLLTLSPVNDIATLNAITNKFVESAGKVCFADTFVSSNAIFTSTSSSFSGYYAHDADHKLILLIPVADDSFYHDTSTKWAIIDYENDICFSNFNWKFIHYNGNFPSKNVAIFMNTTVNLSKISGILATDFNDIFPVLMVASDYPTIDTNNDYPHTFIGDDGYTYSCLTASSNRNIWLRLRDS